MPGDTSRTQIGIRVVKRTQYRDEAFVLSVGIGFVIASFQLNPNGKVIAISTPAERRVASMPGSTMKGHELEQLTVASDKEMR